MGKSQKAQIPANHGSKIPNPFVQENIASNWIRALFFKWTANVMHIRKQDALH